MYELEEDTPLYTLIQRQRIGRKTLCSVIIYRGEQRYAESAGTVEAALKKVYVRMEAARSLVADTIPARPHRRGRLRKAETD